MTFIELDKEQVDLIWKEYASVLGPNIKHLGEYWPRSLAPEERVWLWENKIGWSSIRSDPTDQRTIWLALGVWPGYQNQQYCPNIFWNTVKG